MTDTQLKDGEVVAMTVPAFFDAHVHLRQGDLLANLVPMTARCCDRAVVMPNVEPPITTGELAQNYRRAIQECVPAGVEFNALMTLYLTPATRPQDVVAARRLLGESLVGVKIYPAGGTTNSQHGIPARWLYPRRNAAPIAFADTLRAVADSGLVLNVHAEDPDEPLFNREESVVTSGFFEWYCCVLGGRVAIEHVSTKAACERVWHGCVVSGLGGRLAMSVTLHHLYLTIDDVVGCVHNYCRPCALRHHDRLALREAATRADSYCFLGSDSAPHAPNKKYQALACAGCYTAPVLAEKLAEFFADRVLPGGDKPAVNAEVMARFTSLSAEKFYGVPPSGREVTMVYSPWQVPEEWHGIVPWLNGKWIEFNTRA